MHSLQLRVANQLLQQRAEIALNDLASDCQKQDLTLPCTFSFQLTGSQGSGFLFWNCAANSVLLIEIGTEEKFQCLSEWSAGRSKSHKVDLALICSKIDEIEFDQSEVLQVRVSGHGELHCVGFQQKATQCNSEIASHGYSTQRTLTTAKPDLVSASSDFRWVARRSQRLLPGIGSRVCGPTSLSTLLVQSGRIVSTDAFALRCYDYAANIFGNWSFLIAGASEFGEFALGTLARFNRTTGVLVEKGLSSRCFAEI